MTADHHAATRALLVAELDAPRFAHPGYLQWFYDDNPRGQALLQHEDDPDTGTRIGHYGVLPTRFRGPDGTGPFIFSSNVATDSTSRRSGLFRSMATRMYDEAAATGAPAMIGVGNDASSVVVVERFGWRLLGPMRAKVCFGLWSHGVQTHRVDADFLASPYFAEITAGLDAVPRRDWVQSWDTDFARWRLARPDGGYAVHVTESVVAVSVRTRGPLGIPFAVLLKVWPRAGAALPVRTGAVIAAAQRLHRAPLCIYAGWNLHARVVGVPIPRRLQPSPLNVVLKVLDSDQVDADAFRLDTWELLDMDAY